VLLGASVAVLLLESPLAFPVYLSMKAYRGRTRMPHGSDGKKCGHVESNGRGAMDRTDKNTTLDGSNDGNKFAYVDMVAGHLASGV
jgi:hypothetical protein